MTNFDINKFINSLVKSQQSLLLSMKNQYKINIDDSEFISNFSLNKKKIMELVFNNVELKIAFNSSEENNLQKKNEQTEGIKPTERIEENKEIETHQIIIKKKKPNKQQPKSIESIESIDSCKPTKMTIKKRKKTPKQFENEYAYFVYMCQSLSLDYYKYKLSNLWDSPAIIAKQTETNFISIRKKFDIELNIDILEDRKIAIYPKNLSNCTSIKYKKQYEFNNYTRKQTYNENIDNIEVIEWSFNDMEYLLDKNTNNVYDSESEVVIGIREYDTTNSLWYIKALD